RLVEDEDSSIVGERFRYLNQLLLADAELSDGDERIDGQVESLQQLGSARIEFLPSNDAEAARLASEKDVLADGHVRNQRQFLINDRYPGRLRLVDVVKAANVSLDANLAAVLRVRVDSAQNFHES